MNDVLYVALFLVWYAENNLIHISTLSDIIVVLWECMYVFRKSLCTTSFLSLCKFRMHIASLPLPTPKIGGFMMEYVLCSRGKFSFYSPEKRITNSETV